MREARRLEFEVCVDEYSALLLEAQLIQTHRPKWNIAGAFFFLYPLVGICRRDDEIYLCYTTAPELHPEFKFHGAFRSRDRTRDGFFALTELLRLIGHSIPKSQIGKMGLAAPERKSGYIYGFRQVPDEWNSRLGNFFRGDDFTPIEELSLLLLERPTALARSEETQSHLYAIRRFWRHEILPLRKARQHTAWTEYPVSQRDRDLVFIALRSAPAVVSPCAS